MVLAYLILLSLLGSLGAALGAALILAFPQWYRRLKDLLLAFAIGALWGATFLGLLPSAMQLTEPPAVLQLLLIGLVVFFVLEKLLRIPHAHGGAEEHHHIQPAAPLILIGDTFHNFVDGVVIATAFLASIPLGMLTALAVLAHEIPQELGDFVILLESGLSRGKAYGLNALSAMATVPGGLLTYGSRELIAPLRPIFLSLAAASFLYIATADIAPLLHHQRGLQAGITQTLGLLVGLGVIALIHQVLH